VTVPRSSAPATTVKRSGRGAKARQVQRATQSDERRPKFMGLEKARAAGGWFGGTQGGREGEARAGTAGVINVGSQTRPGREKIDEKSGPRLVVYHSGPVGAPTLRPVPGR
jgi:hypothetical protein